jgi:hypothetical protein
MYPFSRTAFIGLSLLSLALASCGDPVINTSSNTAAEPQTLATPNANLSLEKGFLSGVVMNTQKSLLAGVTVRLGEQKVETDQTGYYQFSQVQPGEVKLIAEAPGYTPVALTVTIGAARQVQDLSLSTVQAGTSPVILPSAPPSSDTVTSPSTSPTPVFLLPDGSSSAAPIASSSPAVQANPTPVPATPVAGSPTPAPTASPLYDPNLDEAKLSELFLKRKSNGLELNFLLSKSNGLPVDWSWGVVKVEYYLAQTQTNNGIKSPGSLITSGRTIIAQSNESFILTLSSEQMSQLGDSLYANYTLTLPDLRTLSLEKEFSIH